MLTSWWGIYLLEVQNIEQYTKNEKSVDRLIYLIRTMIFVAFMPIFVGRFMLIRKIVDKKKLQSEQELQNITLRD